MPMRIIGKTEFNFLGMRRVSFVVSTILTAAGLFALIMVITGNGNLGIEFSGGSMIQGSFANPVDIGEIRNAVAGVGYPDAVIQELERDIPNSYVIRTKQAPGEGMEKREKIEGALAEAFPGNEFTLDSVHEVGPAVGRELREDAMWAVLLSLAGILIYIAFRFDFRFGVAAAVATFHDVLFVLAVVFFLNRELTILVISALLTIAGYSLTDTVVVFDRIRENLKRMRRRADFIPGVNLSINDVLSRTLITSLTTLMVVTVLFVAGGEVLRDFALALICGIAIGTYSSVFVASPLYVEWELRRARRFKS